MGDCIAADAASCLQQPGCRWFSYTGGCPLCEQWFGDQAAVTGCRNWSPADYCDHTVFQNALAMFGGNASSDTFREAVTHYRVEVGTGQPGRMPNKRAKCSVWCDKSAPHGCFGQLRAVDPIVGVNYGGRFIPEAYLGLPGTAELFRGAAGSNPGLCDVAAADGAERLRDFLGQLIQRSHFEKMATLGFNMVRLPVGYWSVLALDELVPNGPHEDAVRWKSMQNLLSVEEWRLWIDRVFDYASEFGLRVLLDLHGAPGAQVSDNVDTGCAVSAPHFDTDWNRALAVKAVGALAQICARQGANCFGVELLNEPDGVWSGGLDRRWLKSYYLSAITEARQYLGPDVPLVIMEWAPRLSWWQENGGFNYLDHGVVMFETHLYSFSQTSGQQAARDAFQEDLLRVLDFYWNSPYLVFIGEYGLVNHGPEGQFDVDGFADWFVRQMDQHAAGSMVWNFDAADPAWGPVDTESLVPGRVDWRSIWRD